jgi:hypothetical protein
MRGAPKTVLLHRHSPRKRLRFNGLVLAHKSCA